MKGAAASSANLAHFYSKKSIHTNKLISRGNNTEHIRGELPKVNLLEVNLQRPFFKPFEKQSWELRGNKIQIEW